MAIAYEVRVPTGRSSVIKNVDVLLGTLSSSHEIDILSTVFDGASFVKATFLFRRWHEIAKRKYVEMKDSRSAIPTNTPPLKELENGVRKKLFEAAESELLASTLIVKIDEDLEKVLLRAEYANTMTENQAEQVAVYLQQRLELVFST